MLSHNYIISGSIPMSVFLTILDNMKTRKEATTKKIVVKRQTRSDKKEKPVTKRKERSDKGKARGSYGKKLVTRK